MARRTLNFFATTLALSLLIMLFQNCARLAPSQILLSNSLSAPSKPDGRTYYVANGGSDSNSGVSEVAAWATVAKVNATVFEAGDQVLFRGGEEFIGCLRILSTNVPGTRSDQGFTISAYGDGRFTLTADCSGYDGDGVGAAAVLVSDVSGFRLSRAILRGATTSLKGTPYGVHFYNPSKTGQVMRNLSVTDSDIGGFYSTEAKRYGGEIFFNTYLQPSTSMDQVYIADNQLHGLAGASSADDNGMMSIAKISNIEHVTIERNLIFDIGGKPVARGGLPGCEGNGIVSLGMKGALIRFNVAHDLGGNADSCGGPGGIWMAQADDVTIEHNEVYRVRPLGTPPSTACDWVGYDFDYSVTNSKIQYNYSHDNWGPGFLLFGAPGPWGPNIMRYNVSINDALSSDVNRNSRLGSIQIGGYNANMTFGIYNNAIFQAEGANPLGNNLSLGLASQTVTLDGYVANNIFYHDAHAPNALTSRILATYGAKTAARMRFLNNAYYSSLYAANATTKSLNVALAVSATLQQWLLNGVDRDPHPLTVDPGLGSRPSVARTCFTNQTPRADDDLGRCLESNFPSLIVGAPARGAGADLSRLSASGLDQVTGFNASLSRPPQDFFGRVLSANAASFNVGADGR